MPIVEWSDDYLLGIQEFDEHHEHLVELLNNAYDEYNGGASSEAIEEIIDKLAEYANYHFAAEEHWLSENSYPKLYEHIIEHVSFGQRVADFQKDFHDGNKSLTTEILSFLVEWLTVHILGSDTDYKLAIAAKNKN
jgi:hemerythrin